jgi:ABC-type uncharacterized transport system substrate-binding protein
MHFDELKRRKFITLLGSAAAWPVVARGRVGRPVVGFLGATTPTAQSHWTAAFVQRLRELGWIEDRTIAIEYGWAEGRPERAAEIAAEFVRKKVDIIVTAGVAQVAAAQRATSSIPIVFAAHSDPVGTHAVTSLGYPGGNITGLSIQSSDLAGKRLELLRELVPNLHRLGIMLNIVDPGSIREMQEVKIAGETFNIEVVEAGIKRPEDIAPAFEALGHIDALFVSADPLVFTNRIRINTLAASKKLPTMHGFREYVESGGLISYGVSFPSLFRRAADMVNKILNGTKPSDIPVEQPTKFDLVVSLLTAKALGIDVPPTMLALADKVIE